MRASGQTGVFWSPDRAVAVSGVRSLHSQTSYQTEYVVVDSGNVQPHSLVEILSHQSGYQVPGWRISEKWKLNVVRSRPVSVQSDLHLSETILSVVTAAVSPARWFLYIFSPCWFLLSLVLMMLRIEHSTAWSDLNSVYCPEKTGEERRGGLVTPPCRHHCRQTESTWSTACWLQAGSVWDSWDTASPLQPRTRHRAPSLLPGQRGPSPLAWCPWWPPDPVRLQGSPPLWRVQSQQTSWEPRLE